jgi:hypothetical protein
VETAAVAARNEPLVYRTMLIDNLRGGIGRSVFVMWTCVACREPLELTLALPAARNQEEGVKRSKLLGGSVC